MLGLLRRGRRADRGGRRRQRPVPRRALPGLSNRRAAHPDLAQRRDGLLRALQMRVRGMSDEGRILRESLRSVTQLMPRIKFAITKAAHGPDVGKRYQLGEAIRKTRQLLIELELQQTQLGWRDREGDAA